MLPKSLIIAALLLLSVAVIAETNEPDLSRLQTLVGNAHPISVNPTPLPGIYEVVLGSQILYVSEDGRFAIQGDMLDLEDRSNLTEVRRSDLRLQAIEAIGEDSMIIFAPENPEHTISVFTDIDCGYCRKLHQEIEDYKQHGIKVRYLAFPRTGIGSESYHKAVSAWCADDPQEAITKAKRGEAIERQTCDSPVEEQYALGQALGIRGTPSLILENGQMVPGYVPAARLAQMLGDDSRTAEK